MELNEHITNLIIQGFGIGFIFGSITVVLGQGINYAFKLLKS